MVRLMDSRTEKTQLSSRARALHRGQAVSGRPAHSSSQAELLTGGTTARACERQPIQSSTAAHARGTAAHSTRTADTALARAARGPRPGGTDSRLFARWSRPPFSGTRGPSLGRDLGEKGWLGCAGRESSRSKCQSAWESQGQPSGLSPQPPAGFSPDSESNLCQDQNGGPSCAQLAL